MTRFQVASFSAGVFALWVASDWPIHDVAERYLFSVHMVQHVAYSIIAAPLLLIGTPAWLARWLLSPRWLLAGVRYLSRLIPATILFNLVVIVTHTPVVVNAALEHALGALRGARVGLRVVADRVDAAAAARCPRCRASSRWCGCCSCSCSRSCRPSPRRS